MGLVFTTIFDNQRFPLAALNDIYSRTASGCSFRRPLVDIAITVYNWEDMVLKSDLIPKDFLLGIFDAIRGKTVRLGGPILFPVEVWYNTMLAPLCKWHEHVEPALYARMNSGDKELEAGDCDSAEGRSETLDYDSTEHLLGQETVADDPEDGNANACWHSALTMRIR